MISRPEKRRNIVHSERLSDKAAAGLAALIGVGAFGAVTAINYASRPNHTPAANVAPGPTPYGTEVLPGEQVPEGSVTSPLIPVRDNNPGVNTGPTPGAPKHAPSDTPSKVDGKYIIETGEVVPAGDTVIAFPGHPGEWIVEGKNHDFSFEGSGHANIAGASNETNSGLPNPPQNG